MEIPTLKEALGWLNYYCISYGVFTKKGKFKRRYSAYLSLTEYTGKLPAIDRIFVMAGTGFDMDKYGFRAADTKLYGIYYFKDKKEIDNLTETRYNEIIADLQKQYKDYLINERENKLKEDFND